jgi:hypothetical protein
MAELLARRSSATTILVVVALLTPGAQGLGRRATTTAALTAFPSYYGGQQVVVRAEVVEGDSVQRLPGEGPPIYLVAREPLGKGVLEIRGEFWDLSRLSADDPRLGGVNLEKVLGPAEERRLKPGEAFCLIVRSANETSPPPSATVRAIVLDPTRYLDQRIRVTGQFRGRNLYGDVPQSPGLSRWDFVLRVADAAVWVTGVRPKGKDFDLDPGARVDTSRWLEVSGVVRFEKGLTWIEANQVLAARPIAETIEEEEPEVVPVGPSPEVVFSAPTDEETDVAPDASIRIQFSRDLEASSIEGQVRVAYVADPGAAERPPTPPDVIATYNGALRVVVLRFVESLEPGRSLRVELLDGIRAVDGASLKPWTLTFRIAN